MKLIIFVRCIIRVHIPYTGDMVWLVLVICIVIPGGQKSQSGNQVAVNIDFNYSLTLDQSYL